MVEPDSPQMVRLVRFACWISKATNTHQEYEILTAFPQQQWLTLTRLNVAFMRTLRQLLL